MKKYKVIKSYMPALGVVVETGSVVHLAERRAKIALLKKEVKEETKKKVTPKKEE